MPRPDLATLCARRPALCWVSGLGLSALGGLALLGARAPAAAWLALFVAQAAIGSWLLARSRAETAQIARQVRESMDAMQAGVVLFDPEDRMVLCNEDFRSLYGPIGQHLTPGRSFQEMLALAVAQGLIPEARGHEQAWIDQRVRLHRTPGEPVLRELPGGRWRRIVERRLSDGSLLAFSTDVTDLVQREQRLQQEVAAREAVEAELRHANATLARLSGTDHLTGLANRRTFERRLEQEWLRAARHGTPLSLLMIDVDHFKAYNDRHGHLQGDACLREVAAALAGCARRPADLLARFGGEEFVLLLPETDAAHAGMVAARCLATVDACAIPHGAAPGGPLLSLSIGHASARPRADESPHELLQRADLALYEAKRRGRHTVVAAPADATA